MYYTDEQNYVKSNKWGSGLYDPQSISLFQTQDWVLTIIAIKVVSNELVLCNMKICQVRKGSGLQILNETKFCLVQSDGYCMLLNVKEI